MRDRVGSTSWPNRHRPYFLRLAELLRGRRDQPLILIVGPGAVTKLCRPLLHDAASNAGRLRRLIGDAARYADQLLRRVSFLPLVSLEPAEVESAVTTPHRLAVADVSPRVLGGVARAVPHAERYCVDLVAMAPPVRADVIIAFNVICRAPDGHLAMKNLLGALNVGGLLMLDERSARQFLPCGRFESVAEKTYRLHAG